MRAGGLRHVAAAIAVVALAASGQGARAQSEGSEGRVEPGGEALAAYEAGDYRTAVDALRGELAACRASELALARADACFGLQQVLIDSALYTQDHSLLATEAPRYFDEATALYGDVSLDRSYAANFLGVYLRQSGDLAGAERYYTIDLAITRELLGTEHPDYAVTLNNIGVLYDNRGRYLEAEPYYRQALAIWTQAHGPQSAEAANAMGNLARNLDNQGRLVEAEDHYREALAIARTLYPAEHPVLATRMQNLAIVLRAAGDYSGALDLLTAALAIRHARLGADHPESFSTELALANALASANRQQEAEAIFASLMSRRDRIGAHGAVPSLLLQVARRAIARSDWARAQSVLDEALAAQSARAEPDRNVLVQVQIVRAEGLIGQGGFAQARELLAGALADLREIGDQASIAEVLELLASLESGAGNPGAAADQYAAADRALAAFLPDDHWQRITIAGHRAIALADAGDPAAGSHFLAARQRARAWLEADHAINPANPALKDSFAWLFDAELAFHAASNAPQAAGQAFELAQLARQSRAERIARLVVGAAISPAVREAERARLMATQQADAAASGLALARSAGAGEDQIAALAARFDEARVRLAAANAQASALSDAVAPPEPLALAEVQGRLRPDEALVFWHEEVGNGPARQHIFVVTPGTVQWLRGDAQQTAGLMADLAEIRSAAERLGLRARGQVVSGSAARAPDMAGAVARLRNGWAGEERYAIAHAQRVYTIANARMSSMPLALLLGADDQQPVETRLASVSALAALGSEESISPQRVLGIGFGLAGEGLPALPFVRQQMDDLAAMGWQGIEILRDEAATPAAIHAAAVRLAPDLVVLATHSLPDPANPGLLVAGADGGSERLTLAQIAALPLDGALVVLSACDTALPAEGDEDALATYVFAFYAAGARGVVISHWPLDDAAGRALSSRFLAHLRDHPEAPDLALALARADIRGRAGGAWSSPYYWAPLSYVAR